jgi:hypothetical protein
MENDESSTIAYLIMRLLDKEDDVIFISQSRDCLNNLVLTFRGSDQKDSEYHIKISKSSPSTTY